MDIKKQKSDITEEMLKIKEGFFNSLDNCIICDDSEFFSYEGKRQVLKVITDAEVKLEQLKKEILKMQVSIVENTSLSLVAETIKVEKVKKSALRNLEKRKPQKVGFFGVTANPPHTGHCKAIEAALEETDEVWVSPVFLHPFQKKSIAYENRLEMLELIIEDFFPLELLSRIHIVEVDKEYVEKFEKIPFTYELLSYLKDILPKNDYYLIIGEDNYVPEVWEKFHKYKEIEEEFKLAIIKDAGIHSTYIRNNVNNLSCKELEVFCYPQVARYLKKYNFY